MPIRRLTWYQRLRYRIQNWIGRQTWESRRPEGCACDPGGYHFREIPEPICAHLNMKAPVVLNIPLTELFRWLGPWNVCTNCGHDAPCHKIQLPSLPTPTDGTGRHVSSKLGLPDPFERWPLKEEALVPVFSKELMPRSPWLPTPSDGKGHKFIGYEKRKK